MSNFGTTDPFIDQAIRVIQNDFGDNVSIVDKKKNLLKFGENENVGTASTRYTIWYTGQDQAHETYAADNTNPIDSISSSSLSDTEIVTVEGHSMSGGNKTFVSQNVTLNGQTRVALTTPLNRITRIFHSDQSSTNLVGEIYGYENTTLSSGKPIDTTKIHVTVPAGQNTSQKASTSLSSQDYWIITSFSAGSLEKTGSNVNDVRLEIRKTGGVFKAVSRPLIFLTGHESERVFRPYIVAQKNSDIRLTGLSSSSGQHLTGDITGFLAIVT